jgi:hypothetical protein
MKETDKTMKNKNLMYLVFILLLLSFGVYFITQSDRTQLKSNTSVKQDAISPDKTNCLADECLGIENLEYPVGNLTEPIKTALNSAIDDEYHALSFYEAVIAKFGTIRPFIMIKGAEEQHIASLKSIYDKYGLVPPKNTWSGKISAPTTLQEACQAGVDAEIANADLYKDKLLPSVSSYTDITLVFENLMNASLQKHLPAFEKCN